MAARSVADQPAAGGELAVGRTARACAAGGASTLAARLNQLDRLAVPRCGRLRQAQHRRCATAAARARPVGRGVSRKELRNLSDETATWHDVLL